MLSIGNNKIDINNINIDVLKKFLYLFFTDPVRTHIKANERYFEIVETKTEIINLYPANEYRSFVEREPGYGSSYINAYLYAFSTNKNEISHEIIKKINKLSMQHLTAPTDIYYGDYKNQTNFYPIFTSYKYNDKNELVLLTDCYTMTADGIKQFIAHWLFGTDNPVHVIAFQHKDADKKNAYHSGYIFRNENGRLFKNEIFKTKMIKTLLDKNDLISVTNEIIKLSNNDEYSGLIQIMVNLKDQEIKPLTEKIMQKIFDSYQIEIIKASCDEDKIKIIVKHVQLINQLHPFCDGNIRTCDILMKKLFKDNGLSLSVLINPNRLDCCSIEEVVAMVKDGQLFFQQILTSNSDHLTGEFPSEKLNCSKKMTFKTQELFDVEPDLIVRFINLITNNLLVVSSNKSSLFNAKSNNDADQLLIKLKKINSTQKQLESLQKVIDSAENKNYSQALRIACYHHLLEAVKIILSYIDKLPIEINATSSNGKTALDWVLSSKGVHQQEIVALLKQHSATKTSLSHS